MMRSAPIFALLFCMVVAGANAQQSDGNQTVLTVRSNLVEVPVLVKTKSGKVVFALTADDFLLTDNGVPQKLTLDQDTDSQPLALAVVVQTGGTGVSHLADYRQLDPILDALIGQVEHHVAVIGFDSSPHLVLPFTQNTDDASGAIANLQQGDPGAAILDGVAFAVAQLRTQPANYRRAILLLSETIDQGSKTTLNEALRLISDTNTTMYSFAFSSTRSAVSHEASKFSYGGTTEVGPAHGCFSHDGANAEYDGHYSKQVLDCISQLAPPVRLATLAFVSARNSLRTNTAEAIAQLTGGEFVHFRNAKDLQQGLIAVSHDVPNYYVLSFHPETPAPGIHKLHVELKDRPQLELKSRDEYWIDGEAADVANPTKSQ